MERLEQSAPSSAETRNVLQHAYVQAALTQLGLASETSTPAELATRIKTETSMWAGIIKGAGITAQ